MNRLIGTLSLLLVVGSTLAASGCAEQEHPTGLNSNLTTNHFRIEVQGPPFNQNSVGVPLPDATVRVEFRDTNHSDLQTGQYLIRGQAQGLTSLQGIWSCTVSYVETGSYAADRVFIWVSHEVHGQAYTTRLLDENNRAAVTVGLGQ